MHFNIGTEPTKIVNEYRYLGITLNYWLDQERMAQILSNAASKALGSVIGKTKENYDLGYHSFTKLFVSSVIPVMDYSIGAWSTNPICKKHDQIQHRAAR